MAFGRYLSTMIPLRSFGYLLACWFYQGICVENDNSGEIRKKLESLYCLPGRLVPDLDGANSLWWCYDQLPTMIPT